MRPQDLLSPAYVWRRRRRVAQRLRGLTLPLQHAMTARGHPLTSNDRRLASLRGIHAGRRAFVVGNGPSLTTTDLDRLTGEVTFGTNKVFVAFGETAWRPTYYVAADQLMFENNAEAIERLDVIKLVPKSAWAYLRFDHRTVGFRELPCRSAAQVRFSPDASRCVFGGGTVTYTALQLAFHMGIREVYLLGVDHCWRVSGPAVTHPDFEDVLVRDGVRNHFHPDYDRPGELWSRPRLDLQERAYVAARAAFEGAGGRVINTTRGGRLDVFPRACLDEVLATPAQETPVPVGADAA